MMKHWLRAHAGRYSKRHGYLDDFDEDMNLGPTYKLSSILFHFNLFCFCSVLTGSLLLVSCQVQFPLFSSTTHRLQFPSLHPFPPFFLFLHRPRIAYILYDIWTVIPIFHLLGFTHGLIQAHTGTNLFGMSFAAKVKTGGLHTIH